MAGPFLVTHPYEFCIKVLDTDTFLLVSVTFKCRLLFQDTYLPFPLSCLLGLFAPLSEMEFQECSLQEGPQNKLKFHGTLTQQLKTEDFLPFLWGSGVWGDEWWEGYREEVLNKQKLSLPLGSFWRMIWRLVLWYRVRFDECKNEIKFYKIINVRKAQIPEIS